MGTVINSLLNLRKLVYQEKRYSLIEINIFRKENFEGREELVEELRELSPAMDRMMQKSLSLRIIY